MASSLLALLLLLLPFFLVSSVTGHNITKILAQFPDFSSFNSLLSQTQLASEINSRQTITVLAAGNSAVSAVSNQPAYVLRRILALHVLLDYYDSNKLAHLTSKTTMLPTLFQTTGVATGLNGYLNLTDSGGGLIMVESAQPGAKYDAHIVKLVTSQPYNISVLEISRLIVPAAISSNYSLAPGPAPRGPPPPPPPPPARNAPMPSAPTPAAPGANAPASAFAPGAADAPDGGASSGNRARPAASRVAVALAMLVVGLGAASWT